MPANDYVRARIDPAIKHEAAAVLATMGWKSTILNYHHTST